ncbi:MAG: chromosome segregation protein SMC, partial [Myxococcaceae bacterium]|nr:chromosome segregation protein SMC [Myxococcaceae bacterium]
MQVLELVVQGVRGFSPSARASFRAGYSVLESPTDIPAPLAALALALLYPDGRGGDAALADPVSKEGRAGLTLQAADGTVYRLVRALGGGGSLHRLDRAANEFVLVTQDSGETRQAMRAAGLPPRDVLEPLFVFTAGQFPSSRPRRAVALPGEVGGLSVAPGLRVQSAFDQYAGVSSAGDAPVAERIAALEQELGTAREVAELQFRMDGVQRDVFQAESRLREREALEARLAAARKERDEAPTAKGLGLPDDIVERVKRAALDKRRHDEAVEKLEGEKAAAGLGADDVPPVPPLWRDPRFLASLVVGGGLLVAGGLLDGMARFLALLAVPAFTVGALLALRFIEELQQRSREAARRAVFVDRRRKLDDESAMGASIVTTALAKVEANTPDEFVAQMARHEALQPAVTELEAALARLQADPEALALPELVARLKREHEALNQRILSLTGGYSREVRDIERDLARVKDSVGGRRPSEATGPALSAVVTGPTAVFDDPCPAPMRLAGELIGVDVPTLWGVVRDRCVQYLVALTDKRYHAIDLDGAGHATVHAPGRAVPAGELPGKDLDLVYLALRLTLAEKLGPRVRLPVLLEDAFGGVVDGPRQALFSRDR